MYKDELADDIQMILDEFFKQEFGNKLTVFNMKGLMVDISNAMAKHEVKE
jgi:hypothetical protein